MTGGLDGPVIGDFDTILKLVGTLVDAADDDTARARFRDDLSTGLTDFGSIRDAVHVCVVQSGARGLSIGSSPPVAERCSEKGAHASVIRSLSRWGGLKLTLATGAASGCPRGIRTISWKVSARLLSPRPLAIPHVGPRPCLVRLRAARILLEGASPTR